MIGPLELEERKENFEKVRKNLPINHGRFFINRKKSLIIYTAYAKTVLII